MQTTITPLRLPKLTKSSSSTRPLPLLRSISPNRSTLQLYLNQVRIQQLSLLKQQNTMRQAQYKMAQNTQRMLQKTIQRRIRKMEDNQRIIKPSSVLNYGEIIVGVGVKLLGAQTIPAQRYKTALAYSQDQLVLYGGLGCDPNAVWRKLNIGARKWIMPSQHQHAHSLSVYGHRMVSYKGNAYIYGGNYSQNITNQFLKVNFKSMTITSLDSAPFRRKQHAMTILSRLILVHGGIQNGNQIKNNLFVYDIQQSKWMVPSQSIKMPFLSHHGMVALPQKNKKRAVSVQQSISQNVYLFGGINQTGQDSSSLFKLKLKDNQQLICEQIYSGNGPVGRHSHCMQFIQPSLLVVYGGRSGIQSWHGDQSQGVFRDMFLFCVDREIWIKPVLGQSLEYRFGMGSCGSRNKMWIFGGRGEKEYAHGSVLELQFQVQEEGEDRENIRSAFK